MSNGIGPYSTASDRFDRTKYGAANGAAIGGALGGATVFTTMLWNGKGRTIVARPTATNSWIGGIVAASGFTSVLASHIYNGSNNNRQTVASAGAALPAGVGAGVLAYSRTHNAAASTVIGLGAAAGAAAVAFVASPFYIAQ